MPPPAVDSLETDVLVIGGGATGVGVVRDAAMRGLQAILIERAGLAAGATGHAHGLLHSGARYAVTDPVTAHECRKENGILRRIAGDHIEDTGGLFVSLPGDGETYPDRLVEACRTAGIPSEEMEAAEALRKEPRLNPALLRAFAVPDASIDARQLVKACARSAEGYGAFILPAHEVVSFLRRGEAVAGVVVVDGRSKQERAIHAEVVVNAAGAWAGRIAALAGCGVAMLASKGVLVATDDRLVATVINRCRMPGDGDILVPVGAACVMGTTDIPVSDPDDQAVPAGHVERMLEAGEELAPGFRRGRNLRAWIGVRPLFRERPEESVDSRRISRSHHLLDHRVRDGVDGLLTITGGKLTTFRLMAEETVDAVCARLGVEEACRTHEEALPN